MSSVLNVTPVAPSCSEHELIAWVREGNDRAFEELYSRYQTRIGTYILGMVGDHGRAEDIAQEVFMSALRRLRDTERPIAFKPWIYEIAKNACVDEFRRTQRTREVPLAPEAESPKAALHSLATPDSAIESKQRLDDLRGAFRGLSETHHRIIVLRELEGLSYSEIGERMGMSRPMVESTLFRARRRLSQEYDELVSGRRCLHVQALIAEDAERPLRLIGLRERRRLARHLAHCQPCRRHARLAGVDEQFFPSPGLARRIAALLPLPWLPWRRGARAMKSTSGSQMSGLVRLRTAAQYVDPSGPMSGFGRAAGAVAALVIGGAAAGGGIVSTLAATNNQPSRHAHTASGNSTNLFGDPVRAATETNAVLGVANGSSPAGNAARSPVLNPLAPFGTTTAASKTASSSTSNNGQGSGPLSRLLVGVTGNGGGLGLSQGGSSSGSPAGPYQPVVPGPPIPNLGGLFKGNPLPSLPQPSRSSGGTGGGTPNVSIRTGVTHGGGTGGGTQDAGASGGTTSGGGSSGTSSGGSGGGSAGGSSSGGGSSAGGTSTGPSPSGGTSNPQPAGNGQNGHGGGPTTGNVPSAQNTPPVRASSSGGSSSSASGGQSEH